MAKNENNSHAFIRKMVENIKQTKDGQAPDDAKINEVHLSDLMHLDPINAVLLLNKYIFKALKGKVLGESTHVDLLFDVTKCNW